MKQTPRDLLLSRHADATSQLDCLRRAALADTTPIPSGQLFHALFYPQRHLWIGLAAAWIVILAVSFSQSDPKSHPSLKNTSTLYAANWSANQAQLHALLSETNSYR